MPSYHSVAAPLWRANVVQVFHVCGGLSDFCEVHIAFQSIEDLVNVTAGLRFG